MTCRVLERSNSLVLLQEGQTVISDAVLIPPTQMQTHAPELQAICNCAESQALGVIIAARDSASTIAECIGRVFAAHHRVGWRASLWMVVVADSCKDDTARNARVAVGAFGEVLQVCARSLRASYSIGARLVADHFGDKQRRVVTLVCAAATSGLGAAEIEGAMVVATIQPQSKMTSEPP
jgi:hypothetical protein